MSRFGYEKEIFMKFCPLNLSCFISCKEQIKKKNHFLHFRQKPANEFRFWLWSSLDVNKWKFLFAFYLFFLLFFFFFLKLELHSVSYFQKGCFVVTLTHKEHNACIECGHQREQKTLFYFLKLGTLFGCSYGRWQQ